ncbi:hypothetical protein L6452_17633 [Arctium lappa]|uniref:Uncharacterized protein n=1 Tax=Arctium lappa TaxID=4217 RepID=A0ACB9C477_ARCLA|nr:hypothetical protein L6452_17633 [Arctium lappa]
MVDQLSSANSLPPLPEDTVPQAMLRAIVNQNQCLLEEDHDLVSCLEVYEKKIGQKKAKILNERKISHMRKADYEDTSRKLWEKTIAMDKLLAKINNVKSRCRCFAFSWVEGI